MHGGGNDATMMRIMVVMMLTATCMECYTPRWIEHVAELNGHTMFGASADIDGDDLIIGSGSESKTAYLYERMNSKWTESPVAVISNNDDIPMFGHSVSIQNGTAVVAGSVSMVFEKRFGAWDTNPVATFSYNDTYFGSIVAIHGDTIGIGGSQAVYLFTKSGTWNTTAVILHAPDENIAISYGDSLALYGDYLAVGSHAAGVVLVYHRHHGVWSPSPCTIIYMDIDFQSYGYYTIAMSEDSMWITAISSERVFVFGMNDDESTCYWDVHNPMRLSGYAYGFGFSVDIYKDIAIVGASISNKAILFSRSRDGHWNSTALAVIGGYSDSASFGFSVAICETDIVVTSFDANKAHVFSGMRCYIGSIFDPYSRQCVPCPSGHYCESEILYAPTPCPSGTYSNVTGGAVMSICKHCSAGWTSDVGAVKCTICLPGTYSSSSGSPKCAQCHSGTFTDIYGATSCKTCAFGYRNTDTGLSAASECDAPNPALIRRYTLIITCTSAVLSIVAAYTLSTMFPYVYNSFRKWSLKRQIAECGEYENDSDYIEMDNTAGYKPMDDSNWASKFKDILEADLRSTLYVERMMKERYRRHKVNTVMTTVSLVVLIIVLCVVLVYTSALLVDEQRQDNMVI